MIWIPLSLLAASLMLAEARKLSGAESGWVTVVLALVCAGSTVGLLGVIFITVDLLALANEFQASLKAFVEREGRLLTAISAILGFALFSSGAATAGGRVANADPQAPLVNIFFPAATAVLGVMLLALAFKRA